MNPLRIPTLVLAIGMAAAGVANAQSVAPNPGGTFVVTNSTTASFVVRDVPVTQTVNDFSTTLTAVLNGDRTMFSQTYALPFSDPTVQAGVAAADAILAADKALASAPDLSSSTTTQSTSVSDGLAVPTKVATGVTTVSSSRTLVRRRSTSDLCNQSYSTSTLGKLTSTSTMAPSFSQR